jgi:adenosylcobinamide-GDP ribazoletransferase
LTPRRRALADGLRLAVGTLTAFPVGAPTVADRPAARIAMIAAPVAVLPVAVAAGLVGSIATLAFLPPLVVAVLVVGCFALGSRALHLDGLADTADGLTASYDKARALEIMRRGNVGPAGVATLVLTVALQTGALAAVVARPWGVLTGVVLLDLARCSLLITCAAGIPAARSGGLGALVAGVVPRGAGWIGAVLAIGVACATMALSQRPWWQGAAAVLLAAIVVGGLVVRCCRRFGGVTGDVLGAGIEVAAAALLVAAAAG